MNQCLFLHVCCLILLKLLFRDPRPNKGNIACKEAIRKRKKALNVYRKYPTQRNLDLFRISRGVARKVIRTSKRDSWHKYVSRINLRRTTLTSVWTMTARLLVNTDLV